VVREQAAGEQAAQLRITRQLVEPLEWAGFAYQGAGLIQTALVDSFNPAEKSIVLFLGAAHLALAAFAWRTKGPFIRGGGAMAWWVAGAFAIPAIVALLAAHGTYASSTACVQACTYPSAPLFFVALYPWIFTRAFARSVAGIGLVGAVCLEWFLLIYLINGGFTRTSVLSAFSSIIWAVVAFALGRIVARLTGVVRKGEKQVQQQKNEEFFDFLHSHIKAGLAAIRLEQPDVPAMLEKVGELERTVSEQRLTQLLSMDRVPLAMLCSERIRAFTGVIHIAETPRSGARTVGSPAGALIDRALGDLLKNAVVHGAATVWVRMAPQDDMLVLEVADDGPGFDEAVMDNAGTSLYRLRAKARELGGDLTKSSRLPRGSQLILTVPAREDR
jgi:signal transduction histidine kinase